MSYFKYTKAPRLLGAVDLDELDEREGRGRRRRVDWGDISAKVSILVGVLTAYTMIRHNWKG